jgi:hypothetical protein
MGSTDATFNVAGAQHSSTTYSTSAVVGVAGPSDALAFNTTYYFQVRSFDGANYSAWTTLGATSTLANAPSAANAITNDQPTSVNLSWSSSGNPASTQYLVQASTELSFASSLTTIVSTTSAVFSGLAPGVDYNFQVAAENWSGLQTTFLLIGHSTTTLLNIVATSLPGPVVQFSWASPGLSNAVRYNYAFTDALGNVLDQAASYSQTVSTFSLTPGAYGAYYFKLQPLDSLGNPGPQQITPYEFASAPPSSTSFTPVGNALYPGSGKPMTLQYAVASPGHVTAKLYTTRGHLVKTLIDQDQAEGNYSATWTGHNDEGAMVASDVYLLVITAPGYHNIYKVAVVK